MNCCQSPVTCQAIDYRFLSKTRNRTLCRAFQAVRFDQAVRFERDSAESRLAHHIGVVNALSHEEIDPRWRT